MKLYLNLQEQSLDLVKRSLCILHIVKLVVKKKTLLYLEFLLWTTNIQTGAGCCWLMKACLHWIALMWKACSKLYVGHVPGKKCAPETEPVFGKVVPVVQGPVGWLSGYKPWEAYKFQVSSISFLIYRQCTTGVTGRNTRQASKKSTPLPVTTTEVEQVQQEPISSANGEKDVDSYFQRTKNQKAIKVDKQLSKLQSQNKQICQQNTELLNIMQLWSNT